MKTLKYIQQEYEAYLDAVVSFVKLTKHSSNLAEEIQVEYENNLSNISVAVKRFGESIISNREGSKRDANEDLVTQKALINKMLKNSTSNDEKQNLNKMLDAIALAHKVTIEKIEAIDLENKASLASKPDEIKNNIENAYQQKSGKLLAEYQDTFETFAGQQSKFFAQHYETVSSGEVHFWDKMPEGEAMPISYSIIATSNVSCNLFGQSFQKEVYHLAPFFNSNNIIIKCDARSKQQAMDLANAIIFRGLLSLSKNLKLHLIDTEKATFNLGELRRLDSKIYDKFITEKRDVQDILQYLRTHIVHINQKLSNTIPTLHEFNINAQVKQNNHIVYFSDFINDAEERELDAVKAVLKNGPRAGVNSIIVLDEDEISLKNDKENKYNNEINELKKLAQVIDLIEPTIAQNYDLDNFKWEDERYLNIEKVINKIEGNLENMTGKIISFTDYLLPQEKWWQNTNDNGIEAQVGVLIEENNKPFNLKISLNADNFSGIITGTPGQGKSSLYHTFICNAITQYSPKEVQFYLVDLKAVEFEMYARESIYLPHIAVVASNSEREFALNVIEELIEESKKRADKYSSVGASGLWSYNSKVTDAEKDPIKILIIDEFIQLFAVNDKIAQRSYDAIMYIIQVSRAFGIQIITACQSLKTGQYSLSSMLPLIPLRFVFKSGDSDNMEMLKQSISSRDSVLKKITYPGQFIINNNFGDENALKKNQFLQALFIKDKEREDLLMNISDYATKKLVKRYKRRVYDLSKLAQMEDNEDLTDLTKIRATKEFEIYLGKAMSMASSDVHFTLKNESASNMLLIGGEEENAPTRVLLNAVLGIMFNLNPNDVEFYIFNGLDEGESKLNKFIKDCFEDSEYSFEIIRDISTICNEISNFQVEITDLKENDTKNEKVKALIFLQSDRINFGFDEDRIDSFKDSLKIILEQGPLLGYHTLIQCNSFQNFDNYFDSSYKKYFKHRVALQMSSSDAYAFVGDDRPASITEANKKHTVNFGYYYMDGSNKVLKFNTYDLPNETWVKGKLMS